VRQRKLGGEISSPSCAAWQLLRSGIRGGIRGGSTGYVAGIRGIRGYAGYADTRDTRIRGIRYVAAVRDTWQGYMAGYAGARDTRDRRIRTLKLLGGIREVVSLHKTHLHVHLVEVDVLVSFLGAGMLVDIKRRLRPVEELDLVGGLVRAGLAGDRAEPPAYRRETCGGVPWGCYVPCCVMGVGGLCDEEGQRRVSSCRYVEPHHSPNLINPQERT
jgi:hypothetical protein